jgi:hypothetical protein
MVLLILLVLALSALAQVREVGVDVVRTLHMQLMSTLVRSASHYNVTLLNIAPHAAQSVSSVLHVSS